MFFWSSQRSCQTAASSANSQSSSSHSVTTRPWFRFRHWRGAPSTHAAFLYSSQSRPFLSSLSLTRDYTNIYSIHSYSWLQLKPSLKLLHEATKWVILFSFSPEAQNVCSRNLFPCIYSEISFRNSGFHQGNILWFRPFFAIVTHLLITRCFLLWWFSRYASWLKLWSVAWASALQPRNLLVECRFTSRAVGTKEVNLGELLLSSRRDEK